MRTQSDKAAAFRALHERPGAFIIPNPWDAGTAVMHGAREMQEQGGFTWVRDTVPTRDLEAVFGRDHAGS